MTCFFYRWNTQHNKSLKLIIMHKNILAEVIVHIQLLDSYLGSYISKYLIKMAENIKNLLWDRETGSQWLRATFFLIKSSSKNQFLCPWLLHLHWKLEVCPEQLTRLLTPHVPPKIFPNDFSNENKIKILSKYQPARTFLSFLTIFRYSWQFSFCLSVICSSSWHSTWSFSTHSHSQEGFLSPKVLPYWLPAESQVYLSVILKLFLF